MQDMPKSRFPDRASGAQYGNQQRPVRRKKRKRNLTLYYILVFALMVTTLVVLSLTVFFNIDEISVLGSTIYSHEQIIAAANIKTGENLFRTNIYQLESNVLENLVNIEEVKVSRHLPSKLTISVTPCVETACLENDGGYYVISRNGKMLSDKLDEPRSGLVVVKGFDAVEYKAGVFIKSSDINKDGILDEILKALDDYDFDGIKTIDITDRLDIVLNYENRIDIELGSSLDLSYKINFAKAVIANDEVVSERFEGKLVMRGESGASLIKKEDITE